MTREVADQFSRLGQRDRLQLGDRDMTRTSQGHDKDVRQKLKQPSLGAKVMIGKRSEPDTVPLTSW